MRLRAEFAHRLRKARRGLASVGVIAAASVLGLGLAWNAGLFSGADAAAAERAFERDTAARRAEHLAFTEVYLRREAREMRVAAGETLAGLLTRAGASSAEAREAMASIADVYNPRRLRPGQPVNLYFERNGAGAELTGIAFRSDPGASVTANRTSSGGFEAREVLMPVTFEIARIAAPVQTSLYGTALNLGATDREVAALADAFSYDVDFQRDVRPGDEFELVFERYYDDQGNTVRTGDLLFVSLESRRGSREFYQFLAPGDSRPDWYDADGKSARRFLMKTPINGARLSSGFGMRRHPVLGYSRMHRGTDFAAPIGTPILAAGDGSIVRAGPFSSYGNYIRIRHANGYETAYAHMSRFARGMRAGARVRQGAGDWLCRQHRSLDWPAPALRGASPWPTGQSDEPEGRQRPQPERARAGTVHDRARTHRHPSPSPRPRNPRRSGRGSTGQCARGPLIASFQLRD